MVPPIAAVVAAALAVAAPPLVRAADETLDVFVIPHSHCDLGWLKTVDEYYAQDVSRILDAVVDQLAADSARRFNWAEVAYFARWYEAADDATRTTARSLVARGQLAFVGGGWVQHDDAITAHENLQLQMALGMAFLESEFGVVPTAAWQIDTFGVATPTLFHQMGFRELVINRIDHHAEDVLKGDGALEFDWAVYADGDSSASVHTHVMGAHYSAPSGFDWESSTYQNPTVTDSNVAARAAAFVDMARERAAWYPSQNLLVPWGDDFKFRNAARQYENMDKLIAYINERPAEFGVHVQYATVPEYFAAVRTSPRPGRPAESFFPYKKVSYPNYYSGFYSSRPLLKVESEELGRRLRAAEAVAALGDADGSTLRRAQEALAIMQHHDAITGTSTDHVNADYAAMLAGALNDTRVSLERTLGGEAAASVVMVEEDLPCQPYGDGAQHDDLLVLNADQPHTFLVFNALGWARRAVLCLRVVSAGVALDRMALEIADPGAHETAIVGQTMPVLDDAGQPVPDLFDVVFVTPLLPAVGHRVLFLSAAARPEYALPVAVLQPQVPMRIEGHGGLVVDFDQATGAMRSVGGVAVETVFARYNSGRHDEQYLFDPLEQTPVPLPKDNTTFVLVGPMLTQLASAYAGTTDHPVRTVLRIYHVETETEVDGAVELVTQASTPLNSDLVAVVQSPGMASDAAPLLTDVNGYHQEQRPHNSAQGRDGNYFPSTAWVSLGEVLSLLTMRGMGASAFCADSACIEVMLHRQTEYSHNGDIEPLLDESVVTDRMLLVAPSAESPVERSVRLRTPIDVFDVAEQSVGGMRMFAWTAVFAAMPAGIHLESARLAPARDGVVHVVVRNTGPQAVDVDFDAVFRQRLQAVRVMESLACAGDARPADSLFVVSVDPQRALCVAVELEGTSFSQSASKTALPNVPSASASASVSASASPGNNTAGAPPGSSHGNRQAGYIVLTVIVSLAAVLATVSMGYRVRRVYLEMKMRRMYSRELQKVAADGYGGESDDGLLPDTTITTIGDDDD